MDDSFKWTGHIIAMPKPRAKSLHHIKCASYLLIPLVSSIKSNDVYRCFIHLTNECLKDHWIKDQQDKSPSESHFHSFKLKENKICVHIQLASETTNTYQTTYLNKYGLDIVTVYRSVLLYCAFKRLETVQELESFGLNS